MSLGALLFTVWAVVIILGILLGGIIGGVLGVVLGWIPAGLIMSAKDNHDRRKAGLPKWKLLK